MTNTEQIKEMMREVDRQEHLLGQVVTRLSEFVGETGKNEGLIECLERLLRELEARRMNGSDLIIYPEVCTGCGHHSTDKIEPPHLGCCPDSNYVSLGDFISDKMP
jgi:predicted Zn-ribbon and HTH transcriptional regulator